MTDLSADFFAQLLYNDTDAQPYSGRGMYGKICPGITAPNVGNALAQAIVACDDIAQAEWLALHCRTDNMGCDVIVYWPSLMWPGSDRDDRDDRDE